MVHLWLVGKRVLDFLLALIQHFSLALTESGLTHYERILVEIVVEIVMFEREGWVTERKFQGEWGVAYQRLLASEN